jgi:hypothetical protein
MKKLLLSLLVATFHITITIILYRERVLHNRVQSDVILFLLPFLASSVGYYLIITNKTSFKFRFVSLLIAPTCALFSLWAAMLYTLNTYGS